MGGRSTTVIELEWALAVGEGRLRPTLNTLGGFGALGASIAQAELWVPVAGFLNTFLVGAGSSWTRLAEVGKVSESLFFPRGFVWGIDWRWSLFSRGLHGVRGGVLREG